MTAMETDGIRLSVIKPRFLHSNSTSHTWPFSAVAELIDNAFDVRAQQIWIDKTVIKSQLCLTFTDNGSGMNMDELYNMLSFGFSDKVALDGHVPIGLYGNGFKSGSMRLGKDAIVFTKNESGMHVGMLSQTYLEKINAKLVLVPIISFNEQKQLVQKPGCDANVKAITTYSLMNSETELLAELEAIPGRKGTRIIIWNLKRDDRGYPDFNFEHDKNDIRIPEKNSDQKRGNKKQETVDYVAPDNEYSLRAYCSILYLKPRIQIILRKQKVKTQLVAKNLAYIEKDVYKPQFLAPNAINITFGYNCRNKEHYGLMMYHNNRLIKAYKRVGCQSKANNKGVGVVGVVECNFLNPIHNKQDFAYTEEYRRTMETLGVKLNDYWNTMQERKGKKSDPQSPLEEQNIPDQTWVQCDSCLKWRKVPDGVTISEDDEWFCSMNTDPWFSNCSEPEEPGANDDVVTSCTYDKTPKKRKCEQVKQTAADKPPSPRTPRNGEMQPSVSSGKRDLEPNQSQETNSNKRDISELEEPENNVDSDHSTNEKTHKRRKCEQVKQMAADKPPSPRTPHNGEMQPSVSSGQRDLEPNQSQETNSNERDISELEEPENNVDSDHSTNEKTHKKRRSERVKQMAADKAPSGRDLEPDWNQGTDFNKRDRSFPDDDEDDDDDDDDDDDISYESTRKRRKTKRIQQIAQEKPTVPQNEDMQLQLSSDERLSEPNQSLETGINKSLRRSLSYENTSAKKQKLNGSGPTDLHQNSNDDDDDIIMEDIGTSSNNIVTENVNKCEGDASNDYSSQGNQPMPGSIQREMETSHQTHHQESSNDTMEQENKRLSLKVQELEKQISDLRSKYEESLKEIDRLKAQCKELQDLKAESGTGGPRIQQRTAAK
ncbi:MORC family CW-type zinc finger protein 3 isoform X1 [Xenopus tropicalis]|uniref:MORC family CW-type zinc finger protein 3 isoform X1 n=2 Tax=Xenopus tropicalis TaxID=8364 RepID=A0A8J1J3I7_XENTR|nr:MORC family CW-type zinc finger protein 3 isoform X1 [Xenopus tropicalis]XP_031752419.1 MORC family CW-type zinc finger protein 3 isoform X1 [Xenopus tropicalis]